MIELLVVIGLAALLATVAVPAFNSIGAARGVTDGAYLLRDAVELARSEAVTRNSYVWLAFQSVTNVGNSALRVIIAQPRAKAALREDLRLLHRPVNVERVEMIPVREADVTNRPTSISELSTNAPSTLQIEGKPVAARALLFTPQGEVTVGSDSVTADSGFTPLVGIGLRQTRGTRTIDGNDAAVVIDGSVGLPTALRK